MTGSGEPQNWKFFLCKVNDKLASIFVDLDLRKSIPATRNARLLWIWVYLRTARVDGLSSQDEFDTLVSIEEKLTDILKEQCAAVLSGRITTDGRREFYYYAPSAKGFEAAVNLAMRPFPTYKVDLGDQADPAWRQYLDVLYPSDEELHRIVNREIFEELTASGDQLDVPRKVSHWCLFSERSDRETFKDAVQRLGYGIESESDSPDDERPYSVCIIRIQDLVPQLVDDAVIELHRTAKACHGVYDGWETEVIA